MSYSFGSGIPNQPPYPPQQQDAYGGGAPYPPNQQAYPNAYPPQPQGYPPQGGTPGYPGYPPANNMPGYPPQGIAPGLPPQGAPGYPPQGAPGYPPQGAPGYPPQGAPGYPPQGAPGYPPQGAPGYPPQGAPGYPPQGAPGYPPQGAPGYPPQGAPGYPPQGAPGYPPQSQGQYPGYPPQAGAPYPGQPPVEHIYQEIRQTVNAVHSDNRNTKGNPTVRPAHPFNPADDAKALRKAMKGFGTDEDALIQVLCHRTNDQIQKIKNDYKVSFGRDLESDIKSEASGKFEKLLVALLMPRIEFYVQELYQAIEGAGTDEDALIETLCSLSNHEIHLIKQEFHRTFRITLESQLMSETSGHFRKLLVSLCTGNRDESGHVDPERARQDAAELRAAGVGQMGTDESVFNGVICQRNYAQLRLICDEYQRLTNTTLVKDIESEFSGDVKDGLKAIVRCATNRPEFFAKCLYNSMAGLGTNDDQLVRLIVTRCEVDLADIKEAFQKKYGKTLRSFIQGDTSGFYKRALYHLIGEKESN